MKYIGLTILCLSNFRTICFADLSNAFDLLAGSMLWLLRQ